MPCFKPLSAYRGRSLNPSGKRPLVFNKKDGYIDLPVEVPCGQCIGCRIDKSQQWATRMMHEAKFHPHNCFITLTYSDEHLPQPQTLIKSDFQKFMKRLRKYFTGRIIRYYMCGEYGDITQRPHFHANLFGLDFDDKKQHSKDGDKIHFTSPTLDKLWGKGHAMIDELNEKTCAYTARYIMKKINGEMAHEHYRRLDPQTGEVYWLQPEYADMSRRPGIGSQFYENFASDLYPSDFTVIKGKKKPVPKFYDRKLEKENPKLLQKLKIKRVARAHKKAEDQTPARMADRETCLKSRISTLKRKI